jgi:predicted dehydrogenase
VKVLICGLGLIGKERCKALLNLEFVEYSEIDVIDPNFGANIDSTPKIESNNILDASKLNFINEESIKKTYDLMIISAPHIESINFLKKYHARGKKILIEKAFGLNLNEAAELENLIGKDKKLYVGFNYRFFEGVQLLKEDIFKGKFGDIINLDFKLGLGHQKGSENTWRLKQKQIPLGALFDPGVHMIDLINHLTENTKITAASYWNGFWDKGYPEDITILGKSFENANLTCRVSNVSWKSIFTINVLGTEGYGVIDGRGRSYGPQTYIRGKRWGWETAENQKASEELVLTSSCENSFTDELTNILENNGSIAASSKDAISAFSMMSDIEKLFNS